MKTTSHAARLVLLLAILILSMLAAAPTQAAPAASFGHHHNSNQCVDHKLIPFWGSRSFIEAQGFNFDVVGDQASVKFRNNLSLDLARDPDSADYTASRMTEIDTAEPIADRVKCWQPTPTKSVVVEYRIRFDQRAAPSGLTENLMLWNAPFQSTTPEPARPITSIGVSRNGAFGPPQYYAEIVQDLDFDAPLQRNILDLTPMPDWLDAGNWHRIRITLSQTTGKIEVAQGLQPFFTVRKIALLHPPEPLGFEFSIDNEIFPGLTVPVTTRDGVDVSYLDIHMERTH